MPLNLSRFFTYNIRIIGTSLQSLVGEYNTLDIIRLILRTHGCFGLGPPQTHPRPNRLRDDRDFRHFCPRKSLHRELRTGPVLISHFDLSDFY